MKVAFICHYFHPEIGAPAARIYEMAREWTKNGHQVKVITCFPNHPTGIIPQEYRGRFFLKENIEGIEVYRNYVFATPNKGFVKKIIGHLSFMLSSVFLSLPRLGKIDVLVVSSPTLFSVISAFIFSIFKRVPFVFEVRDLWPAIFVELGVLTNRFIIEALEHLEMFLYARSKKIVVVTKAFKDNLIKRGVATDKISVITNGADTQLFYPGRDGDDLRTELGLGNKFVVLYIGAHGISHSLHVILEAASKLRDEKQIHFLFVGEGAEKERLIKIKEATKLDNVSFLEGQPKERVPFFYAASDVCLVPLRNVPLFQGFIPSKMFEIMASGKPIIASLAGEPAEILRQSGGAVVIPPEDVDSLTEAIVQLRDEPERIRSMGEAGFRYVSEYYTRSMLARRYEDILHEISGVS
jgi:glycosyltransferase involved in cell wall biosynthesis